MPRGRRPSTAALTRLGARKASEMVILTCRVLHFSRAQSSAIVVTRPETTSSSHRRPPCDGADQARPGVRTVPDGHSFEMYCAGEEFWRDLLEGRFSARELRVIDHPVKSDASSAFADLSLMTNWSLCTTIPATICARASRSSKRNRVRCRPVLFWWQGAFFRDFTNGFLSSISAAGTREIDPADAVFASP